jgi:hypothetical protein
LNSDKLALKVKLDSRMKLINKSQIHVNKQLLRLDLKSLFHQWKLKLELKNATDISTRLARKQYSRLLMKKCLEAWKLSSQSNAKQIMERSIRREFEYQLALQQSEHIKETQKVLLINKLSERIKQLETDYQKVEMLREAQQEELRIKFLRGVSALNQEAMGMFRQKPIRTEPVPVPRSSVVKDLKDPPNRAIHEPTMITNTNGLVTRHFVKK